MYQFIKYFWIIIFLLCNYLGFMQLLQILRCCFENILVIILNLKSYVKYILQDKKNEIVIKMTFSA